MSYMPRENIFKDGSSIYKITLLAARRAVELSNGAMPIIKTNSKNFSTIALEEIIQGKVKYRLTETAVLPLKTKLTMQ